MRSAAIPYRGGRPTLRFRARCAYCGEIEGSVRYAGHISCTAVNRLTVRQTESMRVINAVQHLPRMMGSETKGNSDQSSRMVQGPGA